MIYDTHSHTSPFSTDSFMTIEQVLNKQNQLGIGVILTEHIDFDFGAPDEYYFDSKEYFRTYSRYRKDTLLLGVEIGMQEHVVEKNENFVNSEPFDMVIASVHAVNGVDLYDASFYDAFNSKKDAYKMYLETIIENVKRLDSFDTLGHIDYVCRQAPYADSQIYYADFPDEFDSLLKVVVEKEKVLELNTRRLNNPKTVQALIPIYNRYRELGGQYITIGSDAHKADAIGMYYESAMHIADACNLSPVYYKERKMHRLL